MKLVERKNSLCSPQFACFAASFLILFLSSKSLGLTLGYALDDYATFNASRSHMQGFLLSQGRFTFALLQVGMDFSGLKQPDLSGLGFFFSAGGFLLVCWMTLARWLQRSSLLAIAMGAVLGAHPFFAEYVSFRQSLFAMGICFLLVAGATLLLFEDARPSFGRICAAACLAAVAAGINQIAMALFCIAVVGVSLQGSPNPSSLLGALAAARKTILIGALACLFYFAFFVLSAQTVAVNPDARMSLLGLNGFVHRFTEVFVLLRGIFGGGHPLVGPLGAIFALVAIFTLALRAFTKKHWGDVFVGFSVAALGIILSLMPVAISGVWWPVPRTLIALPLAVALGMAVLSFDVSRIQMVGASCALLMLAVVFAGKSGSLLMNQQRLNHWDIALARDIVFTVSSAQEVDALTPIFIHRAKWAFEADKSMPIGDANLSALSVDWAVDALFEEATGRRLNVALGRQGDSTCLRAPSFPNPGSVVRVDRTIHVCL